MSEETKPMPLILDILGPFVVHFCNDKRVGGAKVRICAPLCKDHHANILTDNDDISLNGLTQPNVSGGYIYELSGQNNKSQKEAPRPCGVKGENRILMLKEDERDFDLIYEQTCHLIFLAPRPDAIFGLHPEPIWIHQNGSQRWVDLYEGETGSIVYLERSRGLRFIYEQWQSTPSISRATGSLMLSETTDRYLKRLRPSANGSLDSQYNITLRFSSNTTSPDTHHEDAFNCFRTMRTLVPDTSTWLTAFDHRAKTLQIEVTGGEHPVDCPASPMVRRDRGTSVTHNSVPAPKR